MIVKGHEGHVISVSTVFKVHYNQKLRDPLGHFGGKRTMAFGVIDAPEQRVAT